jgi:dipeptidyl aminopeptidase/acylaminoacyl peptidase
VTDRDRLIRTSPVARAADFGAPVLLIHGAQDTVVPVSHATAMAAALRQAGRPCELSSYDDEGHQYLRPQNISDLRAKVLDFVLRELRSQRPASADGQRAG